MVFGPVASFRPERQVAPDGTPIDIAWYPAALLDDGRRIARSGLAAHRLAASVPVWGTDAAGLQRAALAAMNEPAVQAARIEVFLDMGRLTVREVGVTGDFPALARFWLQMGHAGCIAAWADVEGIHCPNVYTRPFGALDALRERTGHDPLPALASALGLEGDMATVAAAADAVRGLHAIVAARFADPPWPTAMREATRAEYAYTLNAAELAWRLAVADELALGGRVPAALWYLRYWAYALARLTMVWFAAERGDDIAFLRPERAVRPALAAQCPEMIPLLEQALGDGAGGTSIDAAQVEAGIRHLAQLRRLLTSLFEEQSIPVATGADWRPYQAAAHATGRRGDPPCPR
jgi:hypothetical protein